MYCVQPFPIVSYCLVKKCLMTPLLAWCTINLNFSGFLVTVCILEQACPTAIFVDVVSSQLLHFQMSMCLLFSLLVCMFSFVILLNVRMFLNPELATQKKWNSGRRAKRWILNLLLHVNNLILCSLMCSIEATVVPAVCKVLVVQYQHLLDL